MHTVLEQELNKIDETRLGAIVDFFARNYRLCSFNHEWHAILHHQSIKRVLGGHYCPLPSVFTTSSIENTDHPFILCSFAGTLKRNARGRRPVHAEAF